MSNVLITIICSIGGSILTALATFIAVQINLKASVKSLLQINIYNLYLVCKSKKYRSALDSVAFFSLLQRYYALGGNEYIHDVERRFKELEERDV